jgi:hypothetical protein
MSSFPNARGKQSRAGHNSKKNSGESHVIRLGNPFLFIQFGSGFRRWVVVPRSKCTNLIVAKNASGRENEIGNEQLGYEQNNYEFVHAINDPS